MPRDEQRREEEAFLEHLYDALGEESVEKTKDLRASLKSRGVNVERVLLEGENIFSDFLKRQELLRAEKRLEEVKRTVAGFVMEPSLLTKAKDALARALSGASVGEVYAAYHRKLESIDESDIESLAEDAALWTS